jgi:hypothetical protein
MRFWGLKMDKNESNVDFIHLLYGVITEEVRVVRE